MEQMPFGLDLRHGLSVGKPSAEGLVVILPLLAGAGGYGCPVSRPLPSVAVPFVHLACVIVGIGKPVNSVRDGFGGRRKGSVYRLIQASVSVQRDSFSVAGGLEERDNAGGFLAAAGRPPFASEREEGFGRRKQFLWRFLLKARPPQSPRC